jgi:hypothetical protein
MRSFIKLFILIWFLRLVVPAYAIITFGARAEALGGASVALADLSSAQQNIAAFSQVKTTGVTFSSQNKFLVPGFAFNSFALALPTTRYGTFAFSANYFGFDLYNQTKLGIGYARLFGEAFSAGVQFNYFSTALGDIYGSAATMTVEAGIQYKVNKYINIGAHINNPGHAYVSKTLQEHLPVALSLGFSVAFSSKTSIVLALEKSVDSSPVYKGGLEYHILNPFCLRMGLKQQAPMHKGFSYPELSFGFGLKYRKYTIDFVSAWHTVLGMSPGITISYVFK